MKHFILLICLFPLVTFSQHFTPDFSLRYDSTLIVKNKISSIVKKEIQLEGDSVIVNRVVQKVFFGEDGKPFQLIFWQNEDSVIVYPKGYPRPSQWQKGNQVYYKTHPAIQKCIELSEKKTLPEEFDVFARCLVKMTKTTENDNMIEFVSVKDESNAQDNYYYPNDFQAYRQANCPNDSLDLRTFIRINRKEKWVEFQFAGIYDPPTNVPQTAYHRTVYHYDLSMKLLWKDEYFANLGYYDFGGRMEHKVSRTIYYYAVNGMLEQELTFFENRPYESDDKGIYIKKTLYEVTYWQ